MEAVVPQDAPPPRHRFWAVLAVAVLAIAAAVLWRRPARQAPKAGPVTTRTAPVRKTMLRKTLRVPGITSAEVFTAVMAPTLPGSRGSVGHSHEYTLTIQNLVKPGTYVRKGDIVAQFDRQHMLNRLDDYRSLVRQHELNLGRLKAIFDVRRTNYQQQLRAAKGRMDKAELDARKAPVLSEIRAERLRLLYYEARDRLRELENSALDYDISEASAVRWSEIEVKQSKLEYERAEFNANRMVAKAANDGLVVMLTTRRGTDTAPIQEGDQLHFGQPYMQIVDLRGIVVNATVNQVDAEDLRFGMRASIHFDAYPDIEIPAHVVSVSAMVRQGGWRAAYVRNVPVRLKLERSDPRVIPNLTASVDLVLAEAPPSPCVPLECVFRDSAADEAYVFVQTSGGWEKREVELGLTNNTGAQVLAGLSEGDIVAAERPR